MITVLNGKLSIPESQRFIGFAGDNLAKTIKFLILNQTETDRIYRLYLTFDDGTVNYFTLPAELTDVGVVLNWEVKREHIFKSGNVKAQIKGFSYNGIVYHTCMDTFLVGNSAEFSESIQQSNTEFLQYEERLNSIAEFISDVAMLSPYIGDNGNWFIYDTALGAYVDSGKPSVGQADSIMIGTGAVKSENISSGAIDKKELFSEEMQKAYLSLPVKAMSIPGDISEGFYDDYTGQGVYQIDTFSGVHQVLMVLKPSSDAYLMQILFEYDKVLYRGIYCSEDGVYSADEWTQWCDLCKNDIKSPQEYSEINSIGTNADPHILSYQNSDPTTNSNIRIPLSVLKSNFMKLEDTGNFFEDKTVEGALQQLGAELSGAEEMLSDI